MPAFTPVNMAAKKDKDMRKDVKVEQESDDDGLQDEVRTGHFPTRRLPVSDVMLTMLYSQLPTRL